MNSGLLFSIIWHFLTSAMRHPARACASMRFSVRFFLDPCTKDVLVARLTKHLIPYPVKTDAVIDLV